MGNKCDYWNYITRSCQATGQAFCSLNLGVSCPYYHVSGDYELDDDEDGDGFDTWEFNSGEFDRWL